MKRWTTTTTMATTHERQTQEEVCYRLECLRCSSCFCNLAAMLFLVHTSVQACGRQTHTYLFYNGMSVFGVPATVAGAIGVYEKHFQGGTTLSMLHSGPLLQWGTLDLILLWHHEREKVVRSLTSSWEMYSSLLNARSSSL